MEAINQPDQQTLLLQRSISLNRRRIVMDLVLIAMFIFILWYLISNIEFAKVMNGDVCRICEAKTGGVCQIQYENPNPIERNNIDLEIGE